MNALEANKAAGRVLESRYEDLFTDIRAAAATGEFHIAVDIKELPSTGTAFNALKSLGFHISDITEFASQPGKLFRVVSWRADEH